MHYPIQNEDHSNYRLALADNKGTYYFTANQIIRLEAKNVYTLVYFDDGQPPFTVSKVLKIYEELLKPHGFVRTHRSHLVNKQFVRCVQSDSVIMQDASVAELSRRNKKSVIQQLGSTGMN